MKTYNVQYILSYPTLGLQSPVFNIPVFATSTQDAIDRATVLGLNTKWKVITLPNANLKFILVSVKEFNACGNIVATKNSNGY